MPTATDPCPAQALPQAENGPFAHKLSHLQMDLKDTRAGAAKQLQHMLVVCNTQHALAVLFNAVSACLASLHRCTRQQACELTPQRAQLGKPAQMHPAASL